MYFVFVESFDLRFWNGYIARNQKGISGYPNASMYLAEGLAKSGHRVELVSTKDNLEEIEYMGVKYINYRNFNGTYCDYIVTKYVLNDLLILNKISEYKKIIIFNQ